MTMDLKENIKHLMDLQSIDLQIRKLDEEIATGNAELDKRQSRIDDFRENIEEMKQRSEACEKKKRELEAEIEDEVARIKDRQAKMMNVQTNREYQSLLKEIEDGKETNKQREDETVLLMEEIESITKRLDELENVCTSEEKLLEEERKNVQEHAKQLSEQKEAIIKDRDDKAKQVAGNILKRYELLREKRNGLAIVGVTRGVCQGCNMNIPPQLFNNLLKEQELLTCPVCNRMMFHVPEAAVNK